MGLPASDSPEWEVISPGVRLGYRRGRGSYGRGGTWLAGSRNPAGKRIQARLGRADDRVPADGSAVQTHEQAKEAARTWAKALRTGTDASPPLTVNTVLDRYFEAKAAAGMKSIYDAKSRATVHIRPALGSLRVSDLTIDRIRRWRDDMVSTPKRLRTGRFAERPNVRPVDLSDPESARRRRDTANRTLTTLKAALNWAREHGLTDDDTAWRRVKPFPATTASRVHERAEEAPGRGDRRPSGSGCRGADDRRQVRRARASTRSRLRPDERIRIHR